MSVDSAYPRIDHVTVVPTNYRPEDSEDGGRREADGDEARMADGR